MLKHVVSAEIMHRSIVQLERLPRTLYNALRGFGEAGTARLLSGDYWSLTLFFVQCGDGRCVFSQLWQMGKSTVEKMVQNPPELPYDKEDLSVRVDVQSILPYFRRALVEQMTENIEQAQFLCTLAPAFPQGIFCVLYADINAVHVRLSPVKPRFCSFGVGTYITVKFSASVSFQEVAGILYRLTASNMGWRMYPSRGEWGSDKSYTLEWFDNSDLGLYRPFLCLSVLSHDATVVFGQPPAITSTSPACGGTDDVGRVAALLMERRWNGIYFLDMPPRHEIEMLL